MKQELLSKLENVDFVHKALQENQFQVYYQPKYDLQTEMIAGAEALVRWKIGEDSFIAPNDFIPQLEKNGCITALDAYVWEKVCIDIREWMQLQYPPAAVSVNISMSDFQEQKLTERLLQLLEKYEIPVWYLHLEISEEVLSGNIDQILPEMEKLRKAGFILEMDHFGEGNLPWNLLGRIPIDIIKLGMTFIQHEMRKTTGKGMLNFMISLAKWLNITVVAEGVEESKQIMVLRSMDCNYVQGFYYAKPMPREDFTTLLKTAAVLTIENIENTGNIENTDGSGTLTQKAGTGKHTHRKKNPCTMMIVDDVEMNRVSLAEIFAEEYHIVQMENGKKAWEYLEQHGNKVDIIMLDLLMPVMDGFQLLGKIRKDPEWNKIPVMVTSQGDPDTEQRALKMKADDFISKPYYPEVVKLRVKHLMDSYQLQKMQKQELDKASKKEQTRYQYILDNLDVAFFEINDKGEFYASDKYSLYAVSDENVEDIVSNLGTFDCIYPDDMPVLFEFFDMKDKRLPKVSGTLRMKMKDGSYRWTEMLGFFEYDENGTMTKTTGILRDVDKEWIRQNIRLQDALEVAEKANQAKTDFLARVSHDMRTPLNGILGITKLLEAKANDPEWRLELEQLNQSGKYLLNLIDDTLDVSRIESGKLELHPTVCDGKTAFENVVTMIKPAMNAKNITFHMQAEDLPFTKLYIDVERVEQAVMNILSNAVKFTPEGGNIDLIMENVSIQGDIITDRIIIRDNGIGMSEEFQKHLYEPFTQEHNNSKSIYRGTGLGMTISRQCMELMGGSIDVVSEEGKGTEVTLILPMQVASKQQVEEWMHLREVESNDELLRGKRVLLCEDHPLNAAIAVKLLEKKGMLVEHAENGRIGLEKFMASAQGYYDLILMDIRMPEMDGLEATRAIRNLIREDAMNVPIIAMTANTMSDDIKKAINAGMSEHLGKPVEPDKLYHTMIDFIERPRPHMGKKILIVDDLEMNREFVKKAIQSLYQVYEAQNGVEALEVMKAQKDIVAVITDIQMPYMDGRKLIEKIRENREYDHVAILANTIYGDHRQEDQLLALGANDFVYKPSSPRVILLRLEHILRCLS